MGPQGENLRELIAEQAAQWHVAHQQGGLGPQQAREFMDWLRTSPVHVAEYLIVAGIARDVADAARESTASLEDLLPDEGGIVRLAPPGNGKGQDAGGTAFSRTNRAMAERRSLLRRRLARVPVGRVAGIAIGVLASVALLAVLLGPASRPDATTLSTRHGERRSLQLPDGTVVQLNSDSSLAVDFDGSRRRVTLVRGQVYFKVAKDPARPFSVRVGQSSIRDIGTAFDVYQRDTDTAVTVAEGRVQVSRAPPAAASGWFAWPSSGKVPEGRPLATLGAGEQALVSASGRVDSRGVVDLQQALAWMQGSIAFDRWPIAAVAREFNRYNDVQIDVEDARIGSLPISGTFNAHDAAAFVAFLGSMPDVRVERRGRRIFVKAAGGQPQRRE